MDQKTQRSRAFPPTLCHEVARIILTAPLSYDAVALHRGQYEKLLRYGKPATSSLPPRPASTHEPIDITLAHPQVRYPTEVLNLVLADLPILDDIDPYVRSRGIERYVVHKAKPMHHPRGAVMPVVIRHAPSLFGHLHLLEQRGMIAFF